MSSDRHAPNCRRTGNHNRNDALDRTRRTAIPRVATAGAAAVATALAVVALLGACATPSKTGTRQPAAPGSVLSRLPPGTPGSVTETPATPPTNAETAQRYDDIDHQALREQEQIIREEQAAAAAAAAAPSYGYGCGDTSPWYAPYYGARSRGYPRSGWSFGTAHGWGSRRGWGSGW